MKTTHAQQNAFEPPPSGRKPSLKLEVQQVEGWLEALIEYHQLFAAQFQRAEQRHWALKYMQGQLLALERKSIEPMADALEGGNAQAMQQFISASPWDDQALLTVHQREVAQTLGHPDGVVILDGSDFPKQGEHSVGVARQHCGILGKTANCQASVLLAYASAHGHTLLDRRLFLPQAWFEAAATDRRQRGGIPTDVEFQTKNQLAWSMLETLLQRAVLPFQWITMDEAFGRDTQLLNKIAAAHKYYFAEIPRDTHVWEQRPPVVLPTRTRRHRRPPTRTKLAPDAAPALRVDQVAVSLAATRWRRVQVHEGTKGPQLIEIALLPQVFSEHGLPARQEWLILRRNSAYQPLKHWKFYRANAPLDIPWEQLARLTAWRWPIESTIAECKGELGMDHYEIRNWRGWHHHLTMTILAHHFLVRLRRQFGDVAPALTVSQAKILLNAVLPKRVLDPKSAIWLIEKIQNANFAAYRAHRKRRGFLTAT